MPEGLSTRGSSLMSQFGHKEKFSPGQVVQGNGSTPRGAGSSPVSVLVLMAGSHAQDAMRVCTLVAHSFLHCRHPSAQRKIPLYPRAAAWDAAHRRSSNTATAPASACR